MKIKIFFQVFLAVVLLQNVASAKVWRVNNNPGVQADFTTPQAAHNAASAGDTLHIESSPINYGNLVLSKRLTVISLGNFLATDAGLQYAPVSGTMMNLTISSSLAAGSVLSCNFSGTASVTGCNNLRFERSYIGSDFILTNSDSNIVINSYCSYISLQSNTNNILITNSFAWFIDMGADCSAHITNNVLGSTQGASSFRNIYSSIFQNNILKNDQAYFFFTSTVTNNLSARGTGSNASLPVGNGNQTGVNMNNVFVNPSGTTDKDFMLVNGSLAAGIGVNGEDDGAFGGATPFKIGLQPAIPAIYKLIAPSTTVGNTLNIVFSTRSNN